mgnify:CR=1 FL=1
MVISKLDPTILQSNTCKKMNKVIKSLMTVINKRTYNKMTTEQEEETMREARLIIKSSRTANAKIFGGAVAKRRREEEARKKGYNRYGRPVSRG